MICCLLAESLYLDVSISRSLALANGRAGYKGTPVAPTRRCRYAASEQSRRKAVTQSYGTTAVVATSAGPPANRPCVENSWPAFLFGPSTPSATILLTCTHY